MYCAGYFSLYAVVVVVVVVVNGGRTWFLDLRGIFGQGRRVGHQGR